MTEDEIIVKHLKMSFRYGGDDPAKGLNCWNFVKSVCRDFGRPIADIVDFARNRKVGECSDLVAAYRDALRKVEEPRPVDVVLMEFEGMLHAGVVLSKGRFIHMCRLGPGVCRLGERYWRDKILGYYRVVTC